MGKSFAITKKELKMYFNSPIAYVMITVFLLIVGWFFSSNIFLANTASLRFIFTIVPWIFLFFIPAITMRLIAEEKKRGTIETLVTMPIQDSNVIVGKFLAAMLLLVVALFMTFPYPITVASLGNVDGGEIIGGYIALVLLGALYISIGLFASSLTENQIVAFIIGFLIIFVIFMLNKVLIFLPGPLASFFEYISTDLHFNNLMRGVIDSKDLVYFISFTFLFLFLATRTLASRKWR
ncbi:ABC transporter permease subunit [bacterium]|nr:ABC transporter permease subunit [bacterium]